MSNPKSTKTPGNQASVTSNIHRNVFVNWFLIVLVSIMTVVSAGAILPPVLSDRLASIWQYSKPQMTIIAILCLALLVLGGLAHQRWSLKQLRQRYEDVQKQERERAVRNSARVHALLNVSRMLVAQNDLQSLFQGITKMCVDVLESDQASLMLYDAENDVLEVRAVSGERVREGVLGARQKVGKGIAGVVARTREPMLLRSGDKPSEYPGIELRNPDIVASMVVPVILRDELVGVISVSTFNPAVKWDADDMRSLQVFAENVGVAIRHTEQAEWMRATIRKLQSQKDRASITGVFPVHPAAGSPPGTAHE
jgi:putative methionine-R-sulfoxide reductase with GAF domain